ncbi:hypothetical protein Bbelb_231360 [Branchiostoma belcheri]|nr:hypothetical protein Bbelb_231360 [Branchiostoma belcheri]
MCATVVGHFADLTRASTDVGSAVGCALCGVICRPWTAAVMFWRDVPPSSHVRRGRRDETTPLATCHRNTTTCPLKTGIRSSKHFSRRRDRGEFQDMTFSTDVLR